MDVKKVEEQRKSKLVAETIFGVCLVGAILALMVGIIIVTSVDTVNPFYQEISTIVMGLVLIVAGIVLGIVSAVIKGAQSLSQTKRAKEEFAEQQAAKM